MNLREVERVEVTSLVDNYVDTLLPSTEVARRPFRRQDWFKGPQLIAEHGFSAWVTLEMGGKRRSVLLDSGLSERSAVNNADVLSLSLSNCEAVVLSHGHRDHTGGLVSVKEKIGGREMPLVLHPHAFRKRMSRRPDGSFTPLPPPDRQKLLELGYEVIEKREPTLMLEESVLVTGEIIRGDDFEKGYPDHYAEIEGRLEEDPLILDDQALVLRAKDKGLVVITGCGHSGVINTVSYARELTGEDRVFVIMGGMHLGGRHYEAAIPPTIQELRKLDPKLLIPCHCTGWKAVHQIISAMPDKFIQNSVGTTYIF